MSQVDTAIVAVYFVLVLGVGLWFSRRQRSTEDYFLAGRAIPGWVVSFSLIGTMIGSTTFIGHPGNVFDSDMWLMPFFLVLPIVMIFVSRYVVSLYRHRIRMSVYEYLERRFGYPARAYGSAAFIVSRIVDVSSTLYFLGIAMAYMTGLDVWWVILLVGMFTLAYTLIGGIAAVAWTDVLQSVLLIGGGLTCLATALFKAPLGAGVVLQTAWDGGRFGWGDWKFSLTDRNVWILAVGGAIWALQRYAAEQHMVQRYLVARTDHEARRATYVGAVACVPIWILFMVLGGCIWGFYQLSSETLPVEVMAAKDNIVPYFIRTQCPPGLLGLIIAALAAAAMSSLAADLNSLATVVVDDYYQRLRARSSDRERLNVGRCVVILTGVASVLLAQQWIGVGSAIEFGTQLLSVATAGLLGLFALGLLSRLATRQGAWAGIAACVLFTSWATLTSVTFPAMKRPLLDLGGFNYTLDPFLIGIMNHAILIVVGYGASLLLRGRRPDIVGLTIWGPRDWRHGKDEPPLPASCEDRLSTRN
jgi:SSS family solute:Na+ symporter